MNLLSFFENVSIFSARYHLKGIVRCKNRHFPCALRNNNCWILIDDLYDPIQIFETVQHLYEANHGGWFFTVYTLENDNQKHYQFNKDQLEALGNSSPSHDANIDDSNVTGHSAKCQAGEAEQKPKLSEIF